MTQFWAIFAKYMAAYWRMPEYNGTRILLALGVGFTFGAMFWRLGDKVYALLLICVSTTYRRHAGIAHSGCVLHGGVRAQWSWPFVI